MVRTAFGDGCILAMVEAGPTALLRYKVQLPFGVGYIRPSSIANHLTSDMECVRRGGFMDVINPSDESTDAARVKTLNSSCQCVFGTEKLYIFMRLYCSLIALLEEVRKHLNEKWLDAPYNTKNKRKTSTAKNFYNRMVSSLKDYINEDIEFKRFEIICREMTKEKAYEMTKEKVYEMSALPRLIEKCADALVKVCREDTALSLYDLSHLKKKDPVAQRKQSLNIADAYYRIQYQAAEGRIHFCFLSRDKSLATAPRISVATPPAFGTADQKGMVDDEGNTSKGKDLSAANGDNSLEPSTKRLKLR
jgi:hypothetical protein